MIYEERMTIKGSERLPPGWTDCDVELPRGVDLATLSRENGLEKQ